jgi:hypothetical protein
VIEDTDMVDSKMNGQPVSEWKQYWKKKLLYVMGEKIRMEKTKFGLTIFFFHSIKRHGLL